MKTQSFENKYLTADKKLYNPFDNIMLYTTLRTAIYNMKKQLKEKKNHHRFIKLGRKYS